MQFFDTFIQKYIKDSDDEILHKLVKSITIEDYIAKTVIFNENEPSNDKMYIILKGSVGVYSKPKENVFQDDYKNFIMQMDPVTNQGLIGKLLVNNQNSEAETPFMRSDSISAYSRSPSLTKNHRQNNRSHKKENCINLSPTRDNPNSPTKENPNSPTKHKPNQERGIFHNNFASAFVSLFTNSKENPDNNVYYTRKVLKRSNLAEIKKNEQYWNIYVKKNYGILQCELKYGQMFGQIALIKSQPRNATIITVEDCKLLVITKKHFDSIKSQYSSEMNVKKQFLYKVMPSLDDIHADKYVEEILLNFNNCEHLKGFKLTDQDVNNNVLYFQREGSCIVQYKLETDKVIRLVELTHGSVIGEECQFNEDEKCKFTVFVSSQKATFLKLTKTFCQNNLPQLTLKNQKNAYDIKEKNRIEYIEKNLKATEYAFLDHKKANNNQKKNSVNKQKVQAKNSAEPSTDKFLQEVENETEKEQKYKKTKQKKYNLLHMPKIADDLNRLYTIQDAQNNSINVPKPVLSKIEEPYQDALKTQQEFHSTYCSKQNIMIGCNFTKDQPTRYDFSHGSQPVLTSSIKKDLSMISPEKSQQDQIKDTVLWDLEQNSRYVFGDTNLKELKAQLRSSIHVQNSSTFAISPNYDEILKKRFQQNKTTIISSFNKSSDPEFDRDKGYNLTSTINQNNNSNISQSNNLKIKQKFKQINLNNILHGKNSKSLSLLYADAPIFSELEYKNNSEFMNTVKNNTHTNIIKEHKSLENFKGISISKENFENHQKTLHAKETNPLQIETHISSEMKSAWVPTNLTIETKLFGNMNLKDTRDFNIQSKESSQIQDPRLKLNSEFNSLSKESSQVQDPKFQTLSENSKKNIPITRFSSFGKIPAIQSEAINPNMPKDEIINDSTTKNNFDSKNLNENISKNNGKNNQNKNLQETSSTNLFLRKTRSNAQVGYYNTDTVKGQVFVGKSDKKIVIPKNIKRISKCIKTKSNFSKLEEHKIGPNIHKNHMFSKHYRNNSYDIETILARKNIDIENSRKNTKNVFDPTDLLKSQKIVNPYQRNVKNSMESKKMVQTAYSVIENDHDDRSVSFKNVENTGVLKMANQKKNVLIQLTHKFDNKFYMPQVDNPTTKTKLHEKNSKDANLTTGNINATISDSTNIQQYKSNHLKNSDILNKKRESYIIKNNYRMHKSQNKSIEINHSANFVYNNTKNHLTVEHDKKHDIINIKPFDKKKVSNRNSYNKTYVGTNIKSIDKKILEHKFKYTNSEQFIPIVRVATENSKFGDNSLEFDGSVENEIRYVMELPKSKNVGINYSKLKNIVAVLK